MGIIYKITNYTQLSNRKEDDVFMNKRIFTSLLIKLILLVCTGFTQNAYASSGWQEIYTGWVYFENGTMKTGWILTNGN
jgi:glucan-binding YG repeat protein